MTTPIQMFPRYENPDPWELDELVDAVCDGLVDEFVFSTIPRKNEFPLGMLSMPVTKPVNGMVVMILVDLGAIERGGSLYKMRVVEEDGEAWGDGFMDIKTDLVSLEMVTLAIRNGTMPLHNVTPKEEITVEDYPFVCLE